MRYLQQISQMKASEKKETIIQYLADCKDKEVAKRKRILTKNVPYRIQAPFMDKVRGKEWDVPGIADKLYPPQERKLEKVKKYWKLLLTLKPVHEIYGDIELTDKDISIDHFVPWSYVAHDEFWNLHPTTRSINSSKSNNLPDWNRYFPQLAKLEYGSYEMMWEYDAVHDAFEVCAKEHLNDDAVRRKIYRKGRDLASFTNALEEIVKPIYHSAKNCGFKDCINTRTEV